MQQIPLQAAPSQTTNVILSDQQCQISIYQKPQGLFVDVASNGVSVVSGVLALNAVPIICREYVGFIGNLLFIDTQGTSDPTYDGLGSRYSFVYLTAEENDLIQQ